MNVKFLIYNFCSTCKHSVVKQLKHTVNKFNSTHLCIKIQAFEGKQMPHFHKTYIRVYFMILVFYVTLSYDTGTLSR